MTDFACIKKGGTVRKKKKIVCLHIFDNQGVDKTSWKEKYFLNPTFDSKIPIPGFVKTF